MNKVIRTGTQVKLGPARIAWAYLHSPRKKEGEEQEQYSCAILIPKSETDTLEAVNAAIKEAAMLKWGAKGADVVNRQRYPTLKDGDAPENAEKYGWMAGHWYFNASSKRAPKLFDQWQKPAQDGAVYGGCWVFASVNFAGYERNGNKGVSGYLNMAMKVRDDSPLGGSSENPEEAFGQLSGWGEAPPMPAAMDDDM